eukprot:489346-Rhodomonas_salina.3
MKWHAVGRGMQDESRVKRRIRDCEVELGLQELAQLDAPRHHEQCRRPVDSKLLVLALGGVVRSPPPPVHTSSDLVRERVVGLEVGEERLEEGMIVHAQHHVINTDSPDHDVFIVLRRRELEGERGDWTSAEVPAPRRVKGLVVVLSETDCFLHLLFHLGRTDRLPQS